MTTRVPISITLPAVILAGIAASSPTSLSGSGSASFVAQGDVAIATPVTLSGAATAMFLAQGNVLLAEPTSLSGGATSSTIAQGDVTLNQIMSGAATATTTASGSLSAVQSVSGAALAVFTASGVVEDIVLPGPATFTVQELVESTAQRTSPMTESWTPTANSTGALIVVSNGANRDVPVVTVGGDTAEFLGNGGSLRKELYASLVKSNDYSNSFVYFTPVSSASARDIVVSLPNTRDSVSFVLATIDIQNLTVRSKRHHSDVLDRPADSSSMSSSIDGVSWGENTFRTQISVGDPDASLAETFTLDAGGAIQLGIQVDAALAAASNQTLSLNSRGFRKDFAHHAFLLSSDDDVVIRADGRIVDKTFSRVPGTTAATVALSGTYDGAPSGVEVRVLNWDTDAEVIAFTTVDASPSGGTWSGSLSIPQAVNPYYLEYREVGQTEVFADRQRFFVGINLAVYGQSNAKGYDAQGTEAGDYPIGFPEISTKYKDAVLSFTGSGETALVQEMLLTHGLPVAFTNGAVDAQSLANLSKGTSIYNTLIANMQTSGETFEALLWAHGEEPAPVGDPDYAENIEVLRHDIETDLGQPVGSLKMYVCSLAHANGGGSEWTQIDDELLRAASENANIFYSHSTKGATRIDSFHFEQADYAQFAQRFAYAIAHETGSATATADAQFTVTSAAKTNGTTTTLTLSHGLGTDFTPTSGIAGFEVSDDDFATTETISAAVRTDATTITLTHTDIGTAARKIRYLFGADPTGVGATGAPVGIVVDNGSLSMPLRHVTSMDAT